MPGVISAGWCWPGICTPRRMTCSGRCWGAAGPAPRDHRAVAQGRVSRVGADRAWPGVVLAHHSGDAGSGVAIPGPPPAAGPAGPHPGGARGAADSEGQRAVHQRVGVVAQRAADQVGCCQTGHWPRARRLGQCWAVEVELTPKAAARTTAIMGDLLARTTGWEPGARPGRAPRYDLIVHLCSQAALPAVQRAAEAMPPVLAGGVEVRDLPPGALYDPFLPADPDLPVGDQVGRPDHRRDRRGRGPGRRRAAHHGCRDRRGGAWLRDGRRPGCAVPPPGRSR